MAARIPDGRIEVVSGAGHVAHVENSGAFNQLVADFLEAAGTDQICTGTDQICRRVSNAD